MNPRALSQEASSWYLTHLDPYARHATNVSTYLRPPVLALTLKLAQSKGEPSIGMEIESEPSFVEEEEKKSGGEISHWRKYLHRTSSGNDIAMWNEQDQDAYESLARRTKARMEAFLNGCMLAVTEASVASPRSSEHKMHEIKRKPRVPTKPVPSKAAKENSISLTEGLAGFNTSKNGTKNIPIQNSTKLLRQLSASSASSSSKQQPQFQAEDLATRLELYIRSLSRVRTLGRECVITAEPPRAMRARAKAIVASFVTTVGCVQNLAPSLTRLLQFLTQELLAVDTLGGEVCKRIRRLVLEYEHQTSFASLAFLSSPEVSAETRLTPMIMKYLGYLQKNWENCVSECELERMLSTVLDPGMRHFFKTVEFRSIGHLLEVCQGHRRELQVIEFPPHMGGTSGEDINAMCADSKVVSQAIQDMKREVITVNGHVLPPVRNRKELLQLLSRTLNSRNLIDSEPEKKRKTKRRSDVGRSPSSASPEDTHTSETEHFGSSGNEGDSDGSIPSKNVRSSSVMLATKSKRRHRKRSNFRLSTVDVLTRRLLVASSRTGMGGDAYFVVKDLFGGDDVEVVPSNTMPTYGRLARAGTIEIVVRLASVTIKCHGSFDVYPKALVGDCEPLIQLHTTTTEIIGLQEVRASDSCEEELKNMSDDSTDSEGSRFVLKEKETDKTGWRTLSIRPALYEKVEVWNTPS